MDNVNYCGYFFSTNFDSGNLNKIETVKMCRDAPDNLINTEFNVWTKPDCFGTEYENPNRSWFFFGIHGGEPNKICKINVMNLNKQYKLFSQGMHPVIRIGENGKWERMKENPTYYIDHENFVLSFLHRPFDNISVKYYYAFTYPFTYTECQILLQKYDNLYEKKLNDINVIINILTKPTQISSSYSTGSLLNKSKFVTTKEFPEPIENTSTSSSSSPSSTTDLIYNYLGDRWLKYNRDDLLNEIYYHRELLVNSIEGRRIDLLTISSFHGIQNKTEERLSNLFPDQNCARCNSFKDKKIIFVSSRVHPGETPASFVLNGFLKTLLDRKSIIGLTLRKLYVFKIVPFLNPDGVFNGYYRSDTLGHNLNRVYLNPKLQTQPSIFAVRKLISYYHYNEDIINDDKFDETNAIDCNENEIVKETNTTIKIMEENLDVSRCGSSEIELDTINNNLVIKVPDILSSISMSSSTSSLASVSSSLIEQPVITDDSIKLNKFFHPPHHHQQQRHTESLSKEQNHIFHNELITEIKPILTIDNNQNVIGCVPSTSTANDPLLKSIRKKQTSFQSIIGRNINNNYNNNNNNHNNNNNNNNNNNEKPKIKRIINNNFGNETNVGGNKLIVKTNLRKEFINNRNNVKTLQQQQQQQQDHQMSKIIGHSRIGGKRKVGGTTYSFTRSQQQQQQQTNLNISSDFINNLINNITNSDPTTINNNNYPPQILNYPHQQSNMFLYLDLHGHASKKGIFMYGNHLPNILEAVECMLLPRLMSINCQHFHYDSCVFSERNMYYKGKRDGLSKEGSGRVAIYKTIGLIKSYTLEGNYNMGRYVNVLPPRSKVISGKKLNSTPPKYTPAIFEEVGRALGPSILDLTNSNPLSRLQNSEYRTLQGLRNTLHSEIFKTHIRTNTKALPQKKIIRMKNNTTTKLNNCPSASSSISSSTSLSTPLSIPPPPPLSSSSTNTTDIAKENKIHNNFRWSAMEKRPATTIMSTSVYGQHMDNKGDCENESSNGCCGGGVGAGNTLSSSNIQHKKFVTPNDGNNNSNVKLKKPIGKNIIRTLPMHTKQFKKFQQISKISTITTVATTTTTATTSTTYSKKEGFSSSFRKKGKNILCDIIRTTTTTTTTPPPAPPLTSGTSTTSILSTVSTTALSTLNYTNHHHHYSQHKQILQHYPHQSPQQQHQSTIMSIPRKRIKILKKKQQIDKIDNLTNITTNSLINNNLPIFYTSNLTPPPPPPPPPPSTTVLTDVTKKLQCRDDLINDINNTNKFVNFHNDNIVKTIIDKQYRKLVNNSKKSLMNITISSTLTLPPITSSSSSTTSVSTSSSSSSSTETITSQTQSILHDDPFNVIDNDYGNFNTGNECDITIDGCSSSGCGGGATAGPITSVKKSYVMFKSKNTNNILHRGTSLKRILGKDSLKLKKKKSLINEVNTKRKKHRVF